MMLAFTAMAVKLGDTVVAGQRLGLVGLSGMTEFPHLHFEVAKGGAVVDPFLGFHVVAIGIPGADGELPFRYLPYPEAGT